MILKDCWNVNAGEMNMRNIRMSITELRRFLISYHGLSHPKTFTGEKGIMEYIKRVGCIQYDPLNVVGRNTDLVMQSRIEGYEPFMLDELLYHKRTLADGWDKMMAVYSADDWPYFERLRMRKKTEIEAILHNRNSAEAVNHIETIREYVIQNGPTVPSKIDIGSVDNGRWGHGKLSSAAMDYMFNIGILGIKEKMGTKKVYDLIENLLPEEILKITDPFECDRDFYKWYFKRRIGSIGVYWDRNGGGWLGHFLSDKDLRKDILSELYDDGELILVEVEGFNETFYMRSEDVSIFNGIKSDTGESTSFLAPLDNLLWDRKFIKDIFDFEYSWEVYLPQAKRKYGYYVIPVLYGDRIIARFEPDMHRDCNPLVIKNWWWEEGFKVTPNSIESIMSSFDLFCKYLKADGLSEDSYSKIVKLKTS